MADEEYIATPKERTVKATNIPREVTQELLHKFFNFCGSIERLVLTPATGSPQFAGEQVAYVQFGNRKAVHTAIHLSGTPLMDKNINVEDGAELDIPSLGSIAGASIPATAGVLPPGLVLPGGISVIPPALPPAPIAVPPLTVPTRTSQSNPNATTRGDEVLRTVYVGNIPHEFNPDQLMALFSVCGPIQFCRMAGDASHPARYAFIEFETAEAAAAAFRLNGTQVLDRQLKVNHSKNPIVKPPPKEDPRENEYLKRKLAEAAAKLNKRLAGEKVDDDRHETPTRASLSGSSTGSSEKKRSLSSSSRSRSRSRSRDSKRNRSRSRSRDRRSSRRRSRSRSRSRSRDRHRRDRRDDRRDRDRRDRDRDRSRERDRSRRDGDRKSKDSESKDYKSRNEDNSNDINNNGHAETNPVSAVAI